MPFFIAAGVLLSLAGCANKSSELNIRINKNLTIAEQANFKKIIYSTKNLPIPIIGFAPINLNFKAHNYTCKIYLEGDGFAWKDKFTIATNPTPKNPQALKLAIIQNSANTIYLGRPGQYLLDITLDNIYWTSARFSSDTLLAYQEILEQIKSQYQIKAFEIFGYSGGGQLAALLAANRSDVKLLVTIAGNLDHQAWSKWHKISPLIHSLNAVDYMEKLQNIRQIHFIGDKDRIIPMQVIANYKRLTNANTAKFIIVKQQKHAKWELIWQNLLNFY